MFWLKPKVQISTKFILWSRIAFVQINLRAEETPLSTLQKKNLSTYLDLSRFLPKKLLSIAYFTKIRIFASRSFWLQKSIKNQKILFFSKSSRFQLSPDVYIVGHIPNSKKVTRHWNPMNPFLVGFEWSYHILPI